MNNCTFDLFLYMKGSKKVSRTLRYHKDMNVLFINYDDTYFYFTELVVNNDFRIGKISYDLFDTERLADYQLLGNNKLIALNQDGMMNIFRYKVKGLSSTLVFSYQINTDISSEELYQYFTSMTVCPGSHYVAVSSYETDKRISSRLILFAVDEKGGLKRLVNKSLIKRGLQYHDELYAMSFFKYFGDFPVLIGFDKIGTGAFHSFYYNGISIEKFFAPTSEVVKKENYNIEVVGDVFFSLDYAGNLLRFYIEDKDDFKDMD